MEKPLVAIMVPINNDASTVNRCLRSALDQDYENLLVAALDNRSDDGSYDILVELEREYRDRLYIGRLFSRVSISEHRGRCWALISPRSMFIRFFPATDTLAPNFVSRAIQLFESNEKIGCVLSHTDVIHPTGAVHPVPKYRSCDCVIPGDTQMESFMIHGFDLNVSALYRVEVHALSYRQGYLFNRFPDWLALVMASSISDFGYIHDSLALRGDSKSILGEEFVPSLEDFFEHYLFLQAFKNIAAQLAKNRVCDQFPMALQRLTRDCLRCAGVLLKRHEYQGARSYVSLALAYLPEVAETDDFKQIAARFEGLPQD